MPRKARIEDMPSMPRMPSIPTTMQNTQNTQSVQHRIRSRKDAKKQEQPIQVFILCNGQGSGATSCSLDVNAVIVSPVIRERVKQEHHLFLELEGASDQNIVDLSDFLTFYVAHKKHIQQQTKKKKATVTNGNGH